MSWLRDGKLKIQSTILNMNNMISSSFAVKIDRLPDSLGSNRVAGSFALAYGGYELDGVILAKKLEKTKLIRQK